MLLFRPSLRQLSNFRRIVVRTHTLTPAQPVLSQEIKVWEKTLTDSGVDDAKKSVEYIVAHALKMKTLSAVNPAAMQLSDEQRTQIQGMINSRQARIPVQYVIGEWDFMDLTLKMRPPILIPRPETEELVQNIIDHEPEPATFLEIGCGSGAISLALLQKFKKTQAVAIDCDARACDLTIENARTYSLTDRLQVHHLRLTEESIRTSSILSPQLLKYDMLVSNPPYIESSEISSLQDEVRNHESHVALDGGSDGLQIIKLIMKLASLTLRPEGSLWLEVDSSQPARIRDMSKSFGLRYVQTFTDFQKLDRICWLKRSS